MAGRMYLGNEMVTPAIVSGGVDSVNGQTGEVVLTASDVNALPDTTKYAKTLGLSMNQTTFVLSWQLYDQNGDPIGQVQTVDLPLESVVVNATYDATNKKIVLTLENGTTVDVPVGDLVEGLQSEITITNMLSSDLVDDTNKTHKFVTTQEKTTWNNKQNAISDLETIRSGASAGATAVQPAELHNSTITITQGGTTKGSFTLNQSAGATIALDGNAVDSVNGQTGTVVLDADDVGAVPDTEFVGPYYGTCSTGKNVADKIVSCSDLPDYSGGGTIKVGTTINVQFTYEQNIDDAAIRLNVNGSGLKTVKAYYSYLPYFTWREGDVVSFVYDGSYWQLVNPESVWIADDLEDEVNARINMDNTLNDRIRAEKTRAEGAEQRIEGLIPTVNNPTITFTQGGVSKGSITLNQSSDETIALDAGGGGGSYTAGTGIDITNDVISVTSPTLTNTATGANALTILSTNICTSNGGINIGSGSDAYAFGVSFGLNSYADTQGTSIGYNSKARGTNSIAIGGTAQISSNTNYAIQLGYGTNSESNSFYVGTSTSNNWKMLGSDGKIPDGRLPIATSVSSGSTNEEVVGAKLFYDTCGDIETLINAL